MSYDSSMTTTDTTPKYFVLQFGALIALYVTISSLITLLFTIINLHVPDATESVWRYEGYMSSARFSIAVLIVTFPVFVLLSTLVHRARREQDASYVSVVRWLLYLSILAAGSVLLGNLVWVLVSFLEGEVTLRFILKVLTMLLVVGVALGYYVLDVRDYWLTRPRKVSAVVFGVSAFVLGVVIFGLYSINSPTEARERSLDGRQVQDLQEMANFINEYIEREEELPDTVADAFPAARDVPTAPEDRPSYEYVQGDELSYELCATFSADSQEDYPMGYRPSVPGATFQVDWSYRAGEWCFTIETDLGER